MPLETKKKKRIEMLFNIYSSLWQVILLSFITNEENICSDQDVLLLINVVTTTYKYKKIISRISKEWISFVRHENRSQ